MLLADHHHGQNRDMAQDDGILCHGLFLEEGTEDRESCLPGICREKN